MGQALKKEEWLSPQAFLDMEMASPERHEYVDGEVFAMTGTTASHNVITLNLAALIRNHVRGGPCRAYAMDIKLRIEAANCYFYPDLMVTCTEADRLSQHVMNEPVLVVEVLSPSTALYDRDRKFAAYRRLPSLREYVLVDTERMGIECFRRTDHGEWILHPYGAGENVTLHSLELTFPLEAAYEDAGLPADSE